MLKWWIRFILFIFPVCKKYFYNKNFLINFKMYLTFKNWKGFHGGSDRKESACNAGNPDSIPGLGSSPGEEHGNPLWYSCLENPMGRGTWWATVHGVAKSQTWLSNQHFKNWRRKTSPDAIVLIQTIGK